MLAINEVKVKYEHLDALLNDKIRDIKFSTVTNVIVDLKEVFRKFFRPLISNITDANEHLFIEELASDILNIISHYRNFFFKRGKYTTFYFLYSESECELLKSLYPNYKKEYYEKYFNPEEELEQRKSKIVKKALKVIRKIVDILPNSIYIDTSKYDEFVYAKYLVENLPNNQMNIILSTDEQFAQLINNSTFILNLKGIVTDLIDSDNVVSKFLSKSGKLDINLIPLLLTLSGSKRVGYENVAGVGISRGVKVIETLLKDNIIRNIPYINLSIRKDDLDLTKKNHVIIYENYDFIMNQYKLITANEILYGNINNISVSFNKPKQVVTKDILLELNSKIFTNYPLLIDMITKGEQI